VLDTLHVLQQYLTIIEGQSSVRDSG